MKNWVSLAVLSAIIFCIPAAAEFSNAETIAALGGRVLGAAKACGVDGMRLRRIGSALFDIINRRAGSEYERRSATSLVATGLNSGAQEVADGRTKCSTARDALDYLEHKLSTAP